LQTIKPSNHQTVKPSTHVHHNGRE
jgi:hypothetical protein